MLHKPQAPSRTARFCAALFSSLCVVLLGCTSGLDNFQPEEEPVTAQTEIPLGVDLGLALASPIESDYALTGALLPSNTPGLERRVSFLAFTSAAPADDADGLGTPLPRDASVPADTNGATDLYLIALEDELIETGTAGAQPAAFSRALVTTFRHSRCVNCHGLGTLTGPGEDEVFPDAHPGPEAPVMVKKCDTCHSPQNVPGLEGIEWRAPLEADGDFDFRGLSVEQLATRAQSEELDEHLRNDGRVRWAIEVGNVPFVPAREGGNAGTSDQWAGSGRDQGAVPISFATFLAQLDAWESGGFQTTSAGSVRDVLLVSQVGGGASSANGASSSPSLTWVPNPAYAPGNPAIPAGSIELAFVSEATDLTGDAGSGRQVFRTSVDLFVGQNPSTGAAEADALNLVFAGPTTLVSQASGGGAGNGDSFEPAMDQDAELVAFSSLATDLVAGFTDGNGAESDVFLRDLGGATNFLVSESVNGSLGGGDGGSHSPAIAPSGGGVAFVSTASDLIGDDFNGQADIYHASLDGGIVTAPERASVTSAGAEGSGGDCSEPLIVQTDDGPAIVFTSSKTNLAAGNGAGAQVFLRETGATTTLSQVRVGGVSTAANGPSYSPRLSPDGRTVAFVTEANNLDALRPSDENGSADVMLLELASVRGGAVQARRISLSSARGDASGDSLAPRLAGFRTTSGDYDVQSACLFRSDAENLGAGKSTDLVAIFLTGENSARLTDFGANVIAGPAPLGVQFTDQSTGDPTAWSWDFGDPASGANNSSDLQNPSHVYADPGTYGVTLTVTRADGTDEKMKAAFIRSLVPITSDFSGDVLSGPAPHTVNFTSMLGGDTEDVTYLWDFGDGETSTEANPDHAFASTGTYDVSLSVSGLAGTDAEAKAGYVDVLPPSGSNFTSDTGNGLRVSFTDASAGSPTSWVWRNNGTIFSTLQNPTFDFPNVGSYTVSLTIDGPGGMDATSKTVVVTAVTFEDVFPLLTASCTGCHGSSPGGGLSFTGSRSATFNALVGISAGGPCCGGETRVVPFNDTGSLLIKVIDPAVTACNDAAVCGTGANMGGVSDLALVRQWIQDGAAQGTP